MPSPRPFTLLVCGFGRCGSTLLMRMLDAGGFPIFRPEPPAYEPSALNNQRWDLWWPEAQGRAFKVLDAHLARVPEQPGPLRAIWLRRNPRSQAKSHLKFLRATGHDAPKAMLPGLRRGYIHLEPAYLRRLRGIADEVLTLRFEQVIRQPDATAQALAHWLGGLDAEAMARQVIKRDPACLPYMLETRLAREVA